VLGIPDYKTCVNCGYFPFAKLFTAAHFAFMIIVLGLLILIALKALKDSEPVNFFTKVIR